MNIPLLRALGSQVVGSDLSFVDAHFYGMA